MATEAVTVKTVKLTRDDMRVIRELEKKFQATHGKMTFSQLARMGMRSLLESKAATNS